MLLQSPLIALVPLGGIFAYAVFSYGAVAPDTWSKCIVALAATGLLYALTTRTEWAPPMNTALRWCATLFPVYVGLQLVPIPLCCVVIFSPAKARLTEALAPLIPTISVEPLAVRPSATLFQLGSVAAYLIVFLLSRQLIVRLADRPWMAVLPIIVVGVAQALFGIVECRQAGAQCDFIRGSYIDRNHFAGMLEMAFPFALMYSVSMLCRADAVWLSRLVPSARIGLSLLGAGSILIAIFGSLSRMGSVIAALILFSTVAAVVSSRIPASRRHIAIAGVACAVIVGLYFLTPFQLIGRFTEFATPETAALDRRIIWDQTLRVIKDYPLFGCGLGGYSFTYLKYKTDLPLWSTNFAHNDYLQGLAELGIIGFSILAALITLIAATAIRECSIHNEEEGRFLSFACVAAFGAILLHSLVDFNLYIPANALEFAWIAGVSTGLPYVQRKVLPWEQFKAREYIAISSPYRGL